MNRNILVFILLSLTILIIGCSSSSESFPSNGMIKIQNEVYIANDAEIISEDKLDEQIGQIEVYSTNESYGDNDDRIRSNTFHVGTKLYSIEDQNKSDMIAVEESEGKYILAYNNKYSK